jgi:hypothetical protein
MIWYAVIWYLSWPVLIFVSYRIIRYAVAHYEKIYKD